MNNPATTAKPQEFLRHLIQQNSPERTMQWLTQQEEKLRQNYTARTFYLAFGRAPRFAEKRPLSLSKAQQEAANQLRKGFRPDGWSLSQTVRTYLLLLLPDDDKSRYLATLTQLLETAEVDEQVAVYAALPLLSYPEALTTLAVNGLRTNITLVFDAIALHNPYPADYLDGAAWNQMLLKAVFMNRPLYQIYGADARANPALARMLVDFAHERWAASRPVTPELWRFVVPYPDALHQADLERVIASENSWERAAGLVACFHSESPKLQSLLENYPDTKKDIADGRLTWQRIGEALAANQ